MLSANQIPDLTGSSTQDVRAWWDQMIDQGFNTHPDDDPSDIVSRETGMSALDESACQKVLSIYQQMFDFVGDETYEIGSAAYMNWLGFVANPLATAENGLDFWVRSVQ